LEDLQQLILGCGRRERLAQEKLYRRFYAPLFLLCKRFFTHDHEAMECLNDGMLKVYKKINDFQNEKGEFFNWVYTIVRNTALDKLKLKKIAAETEITESIDVVFKSNLLDALEWKDVYKLLDVLTPATRAVCALFYLEGFTIKEISEKLEVSTGTIKWHLNQARAKLKPVLKTYYS
jgi:RNA polymerase sigma-70 factor (ECF subfamily)